MIHFVVEKKDQQNVICVWLYVTIHEWNSQPPLSMSLLSSLLLLSMLRDSMIYKIMQKTGHSPQLETRLWLICWLLLLLLHAAATVTHNGRTYYVNDDDDDYGEMSFDYTIACR